MIYHYYDTLFVNFHPDLCTICHRLAKIDARVCSAIAIANENENANNLQLSTATWFSTHHHGIYGEATFYEIQLD